MSQLVEVFELGVVDIFEIIVIGLVIILAGMIKIPPLEINFWQWFGRSVGRVINGEVLDSVKGLSDEVDKLKKQQEVESVRQSRQRILRFNDEILFDRRHSKEHFDDILEDIDTYEEYCQEHKDFKNNKAELAIATIREVYTKCLKTHDFLSYTKK